MEFLRSQAQGILALDFFTADLLNGAAIVIAILLIWQYIPDIPGIRHEVRFADPFLISSPSGVANELWLIMRGAPNVPTIWAPLARTVGTALVGTLVACVLGAVGGLAISSWLLLQRVARPFLVLFNAIPRTAMIPIMPSPRSPWCSSSSSTTRPRALRACRGK